MARRTSQRRIEKELLYLAVKMTIKVNIGFCYVFVCTSCISFILETTECLFPLNSRGSGRLTLHCGLRGGHIIQT